MRISTTLRRWPGLFVLLALLAGTAYGQRTVTLRLNTATLPDTLDAMDEIQIRGAIDGAGNVTLPDGNIIDWNDNTTLKPANVGGDFWDITFQIPDNAELAFKGYSQLAEDDFGGGWEDGDNLIVGAGTGDVDLGTHFFNKTGGNQDFNWMPYEPKQDSIAVLYRVFMCTDVGQSKGYNPNDGAQTIGVRGDPLNGMSQLDWGNTNVLLSRESGEQGLPGYDLYSGVAYYPMEAAGSSQEYKFFIDGVADGWESSNNRAFTVPASDSTLHWVYFSDGSPTSCGTAPQTATVVFSVDVTPLEDIGMFAKGRGDSLEVRGSFNGWNNDNPDDSRLLPFPGTNIFEQAIPLTFVPGSTLEYKFFINYNDSTFRDAFGQDPPSGWEEPITTTGANRLVEFIGDPSQEQFLGDQRFNDVLEGNIMPDGAATAVTFAVDMTPAMSAAEPFNPATDSVFLDLTGDGIWAFTQGIPRGDDGGFRVDTDFVLTDDDGDMVYTGVLTVTGPTYSAIQYKYAYGGAATQTFEQGGGFSERGRRRTRFIAPNPDGTWPTEWAFPQETFTPEGTLPFEENPAVVTGIETVGSELPERITLSQNFPNPFNPSTSFEYAIDRTMDVKVRVYDVLGRVVATLVDGVQQAATYRVTFDASNLASGMYLYRIETPNKVLTRQMVLIK